MLAFQANKWLSSVAVLLALALAVGSCQAALSAQEEAHIMSDDYEDDMIRAVRVLWAGKQREPAGFERTQRALITILNELNAPDVREMQLPEELREVRKLASIYLDVCELSRPKCDLVFDKLAEIKQKNVHADTVNQLPFLEVCERAHKRFCDQPGSNENAKKRVWYDLKKEVAKEEEAARKPQDAGGESAGKKGGIWPKAFGIGRR